MLSGGMLKGLGPSIKNTISNILGRPITVMIPTVSECTATGCGYNELTQSALNPSCTVCDGRGQIFTWHSGSVIVRSTWGDPARINVRNGIASGEVGDAQIQAHFRDMPLFERVMKTDHAYVLIDGKRLKPYSITFNSVESYTTVDVRCNLITSAVP